MILATNTYYQKQFIQFENIKIIKNRPENSMNIIRTKKMCMYNYI